MVEPLLPPDAMNPHIRIAKRWQDDDVLQVQVEVCDGSSIFANAAYVSLDWFADIADALERFGTQVYGGLYDLTAGTSGPEFAEGAIVARFHWYRPTQLFISTRQESDFFEFKGNEVASTATMFLRTEPGLLDRFTAQLRAASGRQDGEATLECIPLDGV